MSSRSSADPIRWSLTCRKKLAHVETSPDLGTSPKLRQTAVISKLKTLAKACQFLNFGLASSWLSLSRNLEQLIDFIFLLSNRETRARTTTIRAQRIGLFLTRRKATFALLALEHAITEPDRQHSADVLVAGTKSGEVWNNQQGPPPLQTDELWKCRVCASPPKDNRKARDQQGLTSKKGNRLSRKLFLSNHRGEKSWSDQSASSRLSGQAQKAWVISASLTGRN